MPKLWVTRTEPGASQSVPAWQAAGFEPFVSPLLSVLPVSPKPEIAPYAVPIFTSVHGVTQSGLAGPGRAYAVGEKTAEAARKAGFNDVIVGSGQVRDLPELIDKKEDNLVYVRGERVTLDLTAILRERGQDVRSACVYKTVPADRLPKDALSCAYLTLFSVFGAETFEALMPADWDGEVITLSKAIAKPLQDRRVWIAEAPTQSALIGAAILARRSKKTK